MVAGASLGSASGEILLNADQALRTLNSVETALGKTQTASNASGAAMAKAGAVSAGAGLAIFGALAGATVVAANFEAQMSGVAASLGGVGTASGITEEQFKLLSDTALRIGKDTSFSASEAADALDVLAKAGVSTEDIVGGVADASVALAAAIGADIPASAAAMTSAMAIFEISAEGAADATDTITAAVNASRIDLVDFEAGLRNLGPTMALVGGTFEETSASIAYFTTFGLKAADVGTSLTRALTEMSDPAKADALAQLGVDAFDAQGKFVGFDVVADQLKVTLGGLSKEQQLTALSTVFGAESMDVMGIAAQKGGGALREFEGLVVPAGQAAEQAAQRLDNTKGRMEALKGSLETVSIVIGGTFLPIVDRVLVFLTGLLNAFLNLPAPVQKLAAVLASAGAGFLLLLGAVLLANKGITKFKGALKTARLALLGISAPILIILALLAAFTIAYKTNFLGFGDLVRDVVGRVTRFINDLTETFNRLRSFGINPLQAALFAIAFALSTAFGGSEVPINAAKKLMEVFGALRDAVLGLVDVVALAANGEWAQAWEKFQEIITTAATGIGSAIKTLLAKLGEMLIAGFEAIPWGDMGSAILDGLRNAFAAIPWGVIGSALLSGLMGAYDLAKAGLSGLWSTLLDIGGDLLSAVTGADYGAIGTAIWDGIVSAVEYIEDLATLLGPKALELLEGFVTGLGDAWTTVSDWFVGIGTKIISAVPLLGELLGPKAGALLRGFVSGLDDVWATVTEWFVGIGTKILGAVPLLSEVLGPKARALLRGFISGLDDAWTTVTDWLGKIGTKILEAVPLLTDVIGPKAEELLDGFITCLDTAWENVVSWFSDWGTKVPESVPLLGESLCEKAQELLDGFISGLDTAWSTVTDWFVDIGTKILEAVPLLTDVIAPKAVELLTGFVTSLGEAFIGVGFWLSGIGEKILEAIPSLVDAIGPKAAELLTGFVTALDTAWTAVSDWLGMIGTKALAAVGGMLEVLPGRGRELITGLFIAVYTTWRTVVDWLADIGNKAFKAVGSLLTSVKWRGTELFIGLWSGITEKWDDVVEWLGEMGGKALKAIGELGETLKEAGVALIQGLLDGINEGAGKVLEYMGGLAGALKDKITGGGDEKGGEEAAPTVFTGAEAQALADAIEAAAGRVTIAMQAIKTALGTVLTENLAKFGADAGAAFKMMLEGEMVLAEQNVNTRLAALSPIFDVFIAAMGVKGTSGGVSFKNALNAEMELSEANVTTRLGELSPIFDVFIAAMGVKGELGGTHYKTKLNEQMVLSTTNVRMRLSELSPIFDVFVAAMGVKGTTGGRNFLTNLNTQMLASVTAVSQRLASMLPIFDTFVSAMGTKGQRGGAAFLSGVRDAMNAARNAVASAVQSINAILANADSGAYGYGYSVGSKFAAGMNASLGVVSQAAQNMRNLMPSSPAKRGPLSKPISFAYIVQDLVENMRLLGPTALAGVGGITSALGAAQGSPFGVMPAYASASRMGGGAAGGATSYSNNNEFNFPNATIQSKADAEGYLVEAFREVIAARGYALGNPAGGA